MLMFRHCDQYKPTWPKEYETQGLFMFSRVDTKHNISLTAEDFQNARKLGDAEMLNTRLKNELFCGMVYSILARATSYHGHVAILTSLFSSRLTTPAAFSKERNLHRHVTGVLYHNQLAKNLKEFATEWWPNQSEPYVQALYDDKERQLGFTLRKNLADSCPGVGLKCASLYLRMCGYLDIVPMDRWAIRFTRDVVGADVSESLDKKSTTHGTDKYTRSPDPKQYLQLERKFSEFAREVCMTPAELQMVLYTHRTNWNDVRHPYLG